MVVFKELMCLILVLTVLCTEAKEQVPDQHSIDSLLRAIDKIAIHNYVDALSFTDSTLAGGKDKSGFTTQYLYVKIKKSSELLKVKAHSRALQNLLEIESA